jgi:NADH-quinone oxidoreductase subunit N
VSALAGLLAVAPPTPNPIETPRVDWPTIAPVIALFGAALAIVLVLALVRRRSPALVRRASIAIAFVGLGTAAGFLFYQWHLVHETGGYQTFSGEIAVDGLAVFVQAVLVGACALGVLLAIGYVRRERLELPELLALLLLATTGMMVMAQANDLILVFLSLEIFSIALYVMSAFDRRRLESQEAGLKYFVLGAFSSAIFLYGIALTYGATGTTSLTGIAKFLAASTLTHTGLLLGGFALLLVGLGFKVSAAPFHMWTPDVYEGAPTPITAFMSAATKVAAFAAFLRIFAGSFQLYVRDWRPPVYALAVASLLVGSLAAAVQTDVKRLLAYSSIAQAGYVLIGVQVANAGSSHNDLPGTAAALFYVLVYAVMVIGSFGVVQVMTQRGDTHHSLTDYRGLSRTQPLLAGLLTLFLLAQAGVPLTGGFVAKLVVFRSAVDAGQYQLALIGMLAAVISAFVYLRLVVTMYAPSGEPVADDATLTQRVRIDPGAGIALFVAGAAILVLGIIPNWTLDIAHQATQLLASK